MNEFAVRRVDGRYDLDTGRRHYHRYGLVVLKGLLPASSRKALREVMEAELANATACGRVRKYEEYPEADFIEGDLLSLRGLDKYEYIFFNRELLEVIRALLDAPGLVYWGDSSVQLGEAARGFHKDNVDRYDGAKPDWVGPYGLVRCAFYFQDHTKHSGGLKVRLGSHNMATHLGGRMCDVASEYGDVVVWNMRLTHSGNNRKPRLVGGVCLHPRLEAVCPAWIYQPDESRRIAAFCAFAKPGAHLDRYIERMNERSNLYGRPFRFSRNGQESRELMSRYGVSFRAPHESYGELDQVI